MIVARNIAVAAAGVLILLCGCLSTRTRMIQATDRLEDSASAFATHAADRSSKSTDYFEQARAFADQTREFRQTVGSAGDLQVIQSFHELWRGYHALRDHVRGSDSRHLKPVNEAFVDVQLIAKNGYSYADPTVYALGGYLLDPYYN
jgi:hypothetical protein